MDLVKALQISAHGLKAQGSRLRVIAENVANADSIPQNPEEQPYRRKLVSFANTLNRALGFETVRVRDVVPDRSDFGRRFEPGHPGADAEGYIRTPNVKSVIEMADMREAQRSYEANLKVIEASRSMLQRAIAVLR